jgi:hypothetical protein
MSSFAQKSLIQKIVQVETFKVKQKGLVNNLIGWTLLIAYFYLVPLIGKYFWPAHIEDKQTFLYIAAFSIQIFSSVVYFLQYLPGTIYLLLRIP